MGINVLNAAAISIALWRADLSGRLVAWAAVVVALAALGLHGWLRTRRLPVVRVSRRAVRRAAVHATLLGCAWGLLPAVFFPEVDARGQFYIGVITTGMIGAGVFVLSSIPQAATGYVLALGGGAALALARADIGIAGATALMLTLYCGLVLYSSWAHARTLGARLLAEAQAERQHEVIGLLLKDFEDHASDLLWELDAHGRFVHASERLAGTLRLPAARLRRLRASLLLRRALPPGDEARSHWHELQARFAGRSAFRDLHVTLGASGAAQWWSLSAKPLFDERGALRGWRGVASDITERQLAHRRLRWLAHNDALTGLVNRHQFNELLQSLLGGGGSPATPFAVITFDLDGFKHVNDTRGHAAGDELLAMFGQRLLGEARRSDAVARLGGDEFAMLTTGVKSAAEIEPLLNRLVKSLERPCLTSSGPMALRASMGVAIAPGDGADVDTLLSNADMALYAAKRAGGHRYCFFEATLGDLQRRRAGLKESLAGAIARDELHLVFQPQFDLTEERLCGFEVLLRWHSPEHGEVPPDEFVPIAESAGLIPQVGAWVLQAACAIAREWPRNLVLSINVSAMQLYEPGFVESVEAATAGIEPRRIELEVTESVLVEDAEGARATLRELRARGYRTALDDFGTGYSALGYLRRFPFDTLKIDRSFVRDLSRDGEAQVIVDTILAMARALRLRAVAEGVESAQEAELLRERGCAVLQGHFIGRPMPASELPRFLAQWPGNGAAGRGLALRRG